MFDGMVKRIRERNREEYEQKALSAVTDLRIWIQENAEKAAIAFLVVGILIPLCFKLVLFVLGVAALGAFVVWTVALPVSVASGQREGGDGSYHSAEVLPPVGRSDDDDPSGGHDPRASSNGHSM